MNNPIQLRNPKATRPWQHVLEPVSGYLLLAAQLRKQPEKYSGSWNFGPSTDEVRTVREVAGAMVKHLGRGCIEIAELQHHQHESRFLQLNCDKAHQLLGWYPRWDVDESIAATALWYKEVLEGGVAESITRAQLQNYFPELL